MTTTQNSKVQKRSPKKLQRTLETKLRNYSIAASGMASIAGLMFASPANAEVVATPANQQMHGYFNIYQVDLNNDGIADASISVYTFDYCCSSGAWDDGQDMTVKGAQSGNEVVVNQKKWAFPGKRGQLIGPMDSFAPGAVMAYHQADGDQSFSTHHTSGPWFKMYHRFVGVKFLINDEIHYGWIRLNIPGPGGGTITGYAYETVPNKPITAGFKNYDGALVGPHERVKPVPQIHKVVPLSLGVLAAGAAR